MLRVTSSDVIVPSPSSAFSRPKSAVPPVSPRGRPGPTEIPPNSPRGRQGPADIPPNSPRARHALADIPPNSPRRQPKPGENPPNPHRGRPGGAAEVPAAAYRGRPGPEIRPTLSRGLIGPEKMDFSKFRETGELSDITVVVDGKENRLHKFPLFIKSDFFRVLARSKMVEKERVELADFPGGDETFQLVANYCYSIKVDITRHNVCALRCAAEFLQMNSSANLTDVTDRVLQDTLTSAKLSRNITIIIELLNQCCELGEIAQQANIVNRCILAIIDCWLIATKFNKRSLSPDRAVLSRYEINNLKNLTSLPLHWFKQLFVTARDKCVRSSVLAAMLELYLNVAMGEPEEGEEAERGGENAEATESTETITGNTDSKQELEPESPEEDQDKPLEAADLKGKPEDKVETKEKDEKEEKEEVTEDEPDSDNMLDKPPTIDVKEVIDTLVTELPETQTMVEALTPSWTVNLFCEADHLQCECRDRLFHIVARLLPRLIPKDLSLLPPELLCEIVQEASAGDIPAFRPEVISATIDQYLLDLASQKRLSVDVFSKLVKVVPAETRENHDALFQVLETLLTSEVHSSNEDNCLEDPDRQRLLDEVDFSRLSESILQRAYDAELVPVTYVTQAALALCSRLRGELEEARTLIRMQEDELEKYGLGGRGQAWMQAGTEAAAGGVDSRLYDSNYDLVSPLDRHREAPVASGASYETRRSMESLERAAVSPYCGYSRTEFTSPLRYGSYLDTERERPLVATSFDSRYSGDYYRRPMATRWS